MSRLRWIPFSTYRSILHVFPFRIQKLISNTLGYCWRTQKCRKLCIPHAILEGKKAWKTYATKVLLEPCSRFANSIRWFSRHSSVHIKPKESATFKVEYERLGFDHFT
jgi:hypothetical protein